MKKEQPEVLSQKLLELAKKIQSLAETGRHFSSNDYDLDRYNDIEQASVDLMETLSKGEPGQILKAIREDNGYKTPKVDVRAVVFNEKNEVLMVREKIDGCWSLPGGWADIGYTPTEVAVKETFEEAGMNVRPGELLAVLDKRSHNHPPDIYYIYKIFIRCYALDDHLQTGYETTDVGFFPEGSLPPLSEPRNTPEQMEMVFSFSKNNNSKPFID